MCARFVRRSYSVCPFCEEVLHTVCARFVVHGVYCTESRMDMKLILFRLRYKFGESELAILLILQPN